MMEFSIEEIHNKVIAWKAQKQFSIHKIESPTGV